MVSIRSDATGASELHKKDPRRTKLNFLFALTRQVRPNRVEARDASSVLAVSIRSDATGASEQEMVIMTNAPEGRSFYSL